MDTNYPTVRKKGFRPSLKAIVDSSTVCGLHFSSECYSVKKKQRRHPSSPVMVRNGHLQQKSRKWQVHVHLLIRAHFMIDLLHWRSRSVLMCGIKMRGMKWAISCGNRWKVSLTYRLGRPSGWGLWKKAIDPFLHRGDLSWAAFSLRRPWQYLTELLTLKTKQN